MASDPQATAGPQTEIVAKTQISLRDMLLAFMPIAFGVVFVFLIEGIRDALCLLLYVIAVGAITLLAVRYGDLHRALFDHEGMTLFPRRIGLLIRRPVHFHWDEVVEVRQAPLWTRFAIQLRLNRERKFWTCHSQPINSTLVPKGLWANPQIAEALRAHLPPERIPADLAFGALPSLSARQRWISASVILVCAAMAAGCSFAITGGEGFLWPLLAAVPALAIGVLVMALCALRAPPAFWLVAALLNTFPFLLLPASVLMAVHAWAGLALIGGCLGAAAGAMLGAAVMIIRSRKSGAWSYAGATFVLAAVGFWCGRAEFHQVTGIRVGVGDLDFCSPWTPKGDAFLMTEDDYFSKFDQPRSVCWYSSDLKLERRVVLPKRTQLLAVGQEAALFRVKVEPDSQLWFVPRRAEPRVIDQAPYFGNGMISPDSRHILVPIRDSEGEMRAWKICDLATGKVEPVNLPVPASEVAVIALRDDQTMLWLTGSGPTDKSNKPWGRAHPVPEGSEFPHPGKPYVLWSWKINSAESPAQLYAARTQWLEWSRSDKPERLHVWRVSENPPAQWESVSLDFSQSPPAMATISEEEFGLRLPPQDRSFDGRFEVVAGRTGSFAPAFIVDTKTGGRFRMLSNSACPFLSWSPSAHKLLLEVPELKLTGGLWRWQRRLEETLGTDMVVYLVDMDRP